MSFRIKTIIGIALIEIVMLALLVAGGLYYIANSNRVQLFEQADVSARLLATMTADAVIALDVATLDELVRQAAANPGIVYTRIRNRDGLVLSEAGEAEALAAPFRRDTLDDTIEDQRIDVATAISLSGTRFGSVELGLSAAKLQTALGQATRWLTGVASLEIALVAIFGFVLGNVLLRQLSRLQDAAKRVADGDFGYQIEVIGKDELSQTAESFNVMSAALLSSRRRLEDALELAEEQRSLAETRLLAAIRAMPHGVVIINSDGYVQHLNQAFRNLYSLDAVKEVAPGRFDDIERKVLEMVATVSRDETDGVQADQWETILNDGRVILCSRRDTPDGGVVLVHADVTAMHEAARREQEIQRSQFQNQKMESLGTLAGGIAHEINTPCQYIHNNIVFAEKATEAFEKGFDAFSAALAAEGKKRAAAKIDEENDLSFLREEVHLALQQAREGVERIADIVRAIRTFSHPETLEMTEVDLNAVVRSATLVSAHYWKNSVDLVEELAPHLPLIRANQGQLSQVVLNLVINAVDAIGERQSTEPDTWRGVLTLRTFSASEGGTVLEVEDNGPGIPDAIRDRIFDPFFTTKPVGEGTGQGLTIVRAIVEETHGGKLTLESTSDGTVFRVWLPVSS